MFFEIYNVTVFVSLAYASPLPRGFKGDEEHLEGEQTKSKAYRQQVLRHPVPAKCIYTHNGLLYFHTEIKNSSNVPFDVDYITWKIVDKKVAKRTAIQEQVIQPLRTQNFVLNVAGNSNERTVWTMDKFFDKRSDHRSSARCRMTSASWWNWRRRTEVVTKVSPSRTQTS